MNITKTIKTNKPTIRVKGYRESHLGDWRPTGYIFKKMNTINALNFEKFLTQNELKILKKIIKCVDEIINGKQPSKVDFLPKGFEDEEAKQLNDINFIKYVIYRYKYNLYPNLKILDDYPPCVQIEPTSICNFRCVMCYQIDKSFSGKSHGHMGMMELDLFKRVVDQLEGNVEAVTLASRGEPLLNPNIGEMLSYAGQKFLGFKMNTNASMLNEDLCHKILQSGLRTLVFSADAANKETYEKIRVNGKFESVYKNIARFQEIRTKYYPKTSLQTKVSGVKISDNNQNIDDMVNFWKDHVDDVAFVHYNPWESAYENEINHIKTACSELWRRMFVWYNGDANPCDYDYKTTIFFGNTPNVKKESIKEIWKSKIYEDLRYKHVNSKRSEVEPCKRCISS